MTGIRTRIETALGNTEKRLLRKELTEAYQTLHDCATDCALSDFAEERAIAPELDAIAQRLAASIVTLTKAATA